MLLIKLTLKMYVCWQTQNQVYISMNVDIDEVNKALKEIHEQLDSRVSDEELKTVIQDQATINETLCSENIIGRWLWNSGEIRAGCLVPW
jgi:6-pyruvoyl-tetrahydropterin synthase